MKEKYEIFAKNFSFLPKKVVEMASKPLHFLNSHGIIASNKQILIFNMKGISK